MATLKPTNVKSSSTGTLRKIKAELSLREAMPKLEVIAIQYGLNLNKGKDFARAHNYLKQMKNYIT